MEQYRTLEDFRQGRAELNELHLQNLKVIIGENIRAQWKKDRIQNLSLHDLKFVKPHWSFVRIVFYSNGRCDYIAGQDYTSEIKEVLTAIIGKKP